MDIWDMAGEKAIGEVCEAYPGDDATKQTNMGRYRGFRSRWWYLRCFERRFPAVI